MANAADPNFKFLPFSVADNELLYSVLSDAPLDEQHDHAEAMYTQPTFDADIQKEMEFPPMEDQTPSQSSDDGLSPPLQFNDGGVSPEIAQIPSVTENLKIEASSSGNAGDPENQKNKRRESQNRASRNYRQRKKEYIGEIETQLRNLALENEQLRKENSQSKQLASSLMQENLQQKQIADRLAVENDSLKQANAANQIPGMPQELINTENKIKAIVQDIESAVRDKTDDAVIRNLLSNLHATQKQRQKISTREIQQLVSPAIQANLVILEKQPTEEFEQCIKNKCGWWDDFMTQVGITQEQQDELRELRSLHFSQLQEVYKERSSLNSDIKKFYNTNLADCQPVATDAGSILVLSTKLEKLRMNLARGNDISYQTISDFANILKPWQEAILTLKQYSFHQNHLTSIQLLNNVWDAVSRQE